MMDGKILANASAIDRSKTDFYPTPPDVTHALMDYLIDSELLPEHEYFPLSIWEPACGKGDMSKVLEEYSDNVFSSDLYDNSYGMSGLDFTTWDKCHLSMIVTNPPFKYAKQFIRAAYKMKVPFAFLLKSQYWHAKTRTQLFKDCKPSHVLALNWRPDFLQGSKGGAPTMECIWVLWRFDHMNQGNTTIYDILEKPIIKETT